MCFVLLPRYITQIMFKKYAYLTALLAWVYAITTPFGALPVVGNFFNYSTSALQLNNYHTQSATFEKSPFGAVQIGFDQRGVPHIFAQNETAAAYGIGFCQARDRLFQMEMLSRVVGGRVSEVIGSKGIGSDRFWRKFQFDTKATQWANELKAQNPDEYAALDAYTKGVNAYIKGMHRSELPLEFTLLGFEPSQYRAENMYLLIRYMSHLLCYNENDLKFTKIQNTLSDSLFNFYYPFINKNAHAIYPNLQVNEDSLLDAVFPNRTMGAKNQTNCQKFITQNPFDQADIATENELCLGSNNWVVGPQKSLNGNATLCNDPHLPLKLPSTWYEMHVSVAGKIRHGFAVAGSPYIISGFNDHVAWGMTNSTYDLTDFYKLNINAKDLTYIVDGKTEKLEPFTQAIAIKGQESQVFTYYKSKFGVVDTLSGELLATNWIGSEVEGNEPMAFGDLQRAKNMEEAIQALKNFQQAPQNFVLADTKGNIGLLTAGSIALHQQPQRGIIVARSINDLVKYVPFHAITNEKNPAKGYLVSANQNHTLDSISAFLSSRYEASARGTRIEQLINQKEKLSVQDLKNIHTDNLDLEWFLLKDKMLQNIDPADLNYLKDFDGIHDTNAIGATQFYAFKRQLIKLTQRAINPNIIDFPPQEEDIVYKINQNELLPSTKGVLSVNQLIKTAWDSTKAELTKRLGKNPEKWQYKHYHKVTINHIVGLKQFSVEPFGINGNNRTVNVAGGVWVTQGPSMRTLIEMKPTGVEAQTMLTGGQSGRYDNPNYDDQIKDWVQGAYHKVALPKDFLATQYQTTIMFSK